MPHTAVRLRLIDSPLELYVRVNDRWLSNFFLQECSGSVCLMSDLEACQCQPSTSDNFNDAQLCHLCCMRPGDLQSCR